jgi:1-acyl-sn-glycerol-3-phosphate acyltransferase
MGMRYLYVIYALITFVLFFLLLFPFFLLFSLFKKPGRKLIWHLIKAWAYIWFFLLGMPVRRIFKARPEKGKTYIVVSNHRSYLDTALIFRVMPFLVRPLATKELTNIPLFGFLYRQMAILVDRNDEHSRALSVKLLRRVLRQESSIYIFPEGSFNETERPLKDFYKGAFRIALQTRTPILPVIFPDTVQRWHYSSFWAWSPGICRAIFLPVVEVASYSEGQSDALRARVFALMEAALKEAGHPDS